MVASIKLTVISMSGITIKLIEWRQTFEGNNKTVGYEEIRKKAPHIP